MTPEERERVLRKGRRLYGRCLDKGDLLCVTGFVDHQLGRERARQALMEEYLAWLRAQQAALQTDPHAPAADAQLTARLVTAVAQRLQAAGPEQDPAA